MISDNNFFLGFRKLGCAVLRQTLADLRIRAPLAEHIRRGRKSDHRPTKDEVTVINAFSSAAIWAFSSQCDHTSYPFTLRSICGQINVSHVRAVNGLYRELNSSQARAVEAIFRRSHYTFADDLETDRRLSVVTVQRRRLASPPRRHRKEQEQEVAY